MYYAKSKPVESIKEHTDRLLENLELLKNSYGKEILKGKNIDEERFWWLLKIICTYHDIGKVYTPFQNKIREKLGQEKIQTRFNYEMAKHEELSPIFIPVQKLGLTKEEQKLVYQVIFYHHEREKTVVNNIVVSQIIKDDILPQIDKIEKEMQIEIEKNPNVFYLRQIGRGKVDRIHEGDELYIEYCLLKGFLHRLDHSSSAQIKVEDSVKESVNELVEKEFSILREIQEFSKTYAEDNLLIIGSTGIGNKEAALLWSERSKMFFTLPIRVSINAIFDRIYTQIGYSHVGLLHSSALDYLEEKEEFKSSMECYEQSKNLAEKITTCTIDQIFPFVFKYKGYEKMYATLSYSKIVIDEIQAYSPEIVAIILKGLEMIHKIGGHFMVMTATLPKIYTDKLEEMGINFRFNKFISDVLRHKISIQKKSMKEDLDNIGEKANKHKVLVIVNTINKAIELFSLLKEKKYENVQLLHSRFIKRDRNRKEKEILEFSKNQEENGIWITTQLVEASLDIDFDYLFTEMSTLDSLFQRFGRCYRKRSYKGEKANVFIYSKDISGIGYVYDKEIYSKSMELIEAYNGRFIEEKEKVTLVEKLYCRQNLDGTKFLETFEDSMDILNNIIDYDTSKTQAQKLLRNIENITVIPKKIYDENLSLFKQYEQETDYKVKSKIKRELNKLTTNISKKQQKILKEYLITNPYLEDTFIIDLKYESERGLILRKDEEYDLEERFN